MSPITHFLVGWTLANSIPSLEKRDRTLITVASVVPDIDGLGVVADLLTRNSAQPSDWFGEYHHILHNLGFAIFVAVLAGCYAQRKTLTAFLVFLSFHLHLFCDFIGARGPDGDQWPLPYLLPFSNSLHLSWSGQWALNAWPNMVLTAVLLAISIILAVKRGFSFLELFSTRADRIVVQTLRQRLAFIPYHKQM